MVQRTCDQGDIACYLLEGKNKLYVQVIGSGIYRKNWGELCNQKTGFKR